MSKFTQSLGLYVLMSISTLALADVISLTDGTILEGELIGKDNGIVMFRVGGVIRTFPEAQVAALVETDDSVQAVDSAISSPVYTIPAGTRLVLTMSDTVDTRSHSVGHKFRAQLESAIVIDGVTLIPRGATLHGEITEARQAGRLVGRSEMAMEFTDIMIGQQLLPIATGELAIQGGASEGGRTLGRAARGALLGGLIDGSDGARTGAKVGVGVSLLTKGANINVTRGTILETELRVPLSIRQ